MMEETELEMAERHVREAVAHIASQRELIDQLHFNGHNTAQAETLLLTFESTLEQHRAGLWQIRRELGITGKR